MKQEELKECKWYLREVYTYAIKIPLKLYTVITFKDLDKIGWRNRFKKDNKSEDPYDFPAMGWLSWKIFRI